MLTPFVLHRWMVVCDYFGLGENRNLCKWPLTKPPLGSPLTVSAWHFSENSRRLWLFPGSLWGFPRESLALAGFPESRSAWSTRVSGTGKGPPDTNLGSTLPWTLCPRILWGVFFWIDSYSPYDFSWNSGHSQRRDRILRFFLRPEIGQFSPHFGAISLLNCTVNLEKRGENPLEKIKKNQWRRRPELADFCPLSWSNVSWEIFMLEFKTLRESFVLQRCQPNG